MRRWSGCDPDDLPLPQLHFAPACIRVAAEVIQYKEALVSREALLTLDDCLHDVARRIARAAAGFNSLGASPSNPTPPDEPPSIIAERFHLGAAQYLFKAGSTSGWWPAAAVSSAPGMADAVARWLARPPADRAADSASVPPDVDFIDGESVLAAIRSVLPGDLAGEAAEKAAEALAACEAAGRTLLTAPEAKAEEGEGEVGQEWPVALTASIASAYAHTPVSTPAAVALAAALERVAAVLIERAGDYTDDLRQGFTVNRHIVNAIASDIDLFTLFSGVVLGGGSACTVEGWDRPPKGAFREDYVNKERFRIFDEEEEDDKKAVLRLIGSTKSQREEEDPRAWEDSLWGDKELSPQHRADHAHPFAVSSATKDGRGYCFLETEFNASIGEAKNPGDIPVMEPLEPRRELLDNISIDQLQALAAKAAVLAVDGSTMWELKEQLRNFVKKVVERVAAVAGHKQVTTVGITDVVVALWKSGQDHDPTEQPLRLYGTGRLGQALLASELCTPLPLALADRSGWTEAAAAAEQQRGAAALARHCTMLDEAKAEKDAEEEEDDEPDWSARYSYFEELTPEQLLETHENTALLVDEMIKNTLPVIPAVPFATLVAALAAETKTK